MLLVVFRHYYKGENFCDFLFAFMHTKPFVKVIYSKGTEFAPKRKQIISF